MFSQRFCQNIATATKISYLCSANLLVFSADSKQFVVISEYYKVRSVKINYFFVIFWILSSLGFIINFYIGNDTSKFYICFVYWLAIAFVSGYMIVVWFPSDFCQTINLTFRYLKYYQGDTK